MCMYKEILPWQKQFVMRHLVKRSDKAWNGTYWSYFERNVMKHCHYPPIPSPIGHFQVMGEQLEVYHIPNHQSVKKKLYFFM